MIKRTDRLYDAHSLKVQEMYPDIPCNFGWVQDPDSITSKIYTNPRHFVASFFDEDGKIAHEIA